MSADKFLIDCPSPPHRAVAGALRYALTGDLAPGVIEDCAASDERAFAEIAQTHYIDTMLTPAFREASPIAPCFPDDLALFFREMAAANARRNARLKALLTTLRKAFAGAGLEAVALKGATELVAPWWAAPETRYLSDLDLLLPEDHLDHARDLLMGLGAIEASSDGPADHHHRPPLKAPDWEAMVELHQEIGPPPLSSALPSEALYARRIPVLPGLAVPSPADRLLHLLLHAPKGGAGLRGGRLYLREIANVHAAGQALSKGKVRAIEERIAREAPEAVTLPFPALTDAILGAGERPEDQGARQALRRFGQPDLDHAGDTLAWAGYYTRRALTDPEQRRAYLKKLLRPGGLKAVRDFHARRRRLMR